MFKPIPRVSVAVYALKLWQALSGILVMFFTAKCLTLTEQGFYYTFVSLASLNLLFELGLSSMLSTAAAHQFVGQSWGRDGRVVGNAPFKFICLVKYSIKWYFFAATLSFIIIFPFGVWYISSSTLDSQVVWFGPWFLMCLSTSVALLPMPMVFLFEGTGRVAESYFVRIVQSLVGGGGALLLLIAGEKLYAAAMPAIGSLIVGGIWILVSGRDFLIQTFQESRNDGFSPKGLLALQWRTAFSWLAGYALVLMYVPLLFRTQGPASAGQMALTMNVVNMTVVLAGAWLLGQLPSITACVATQNWTQSDLLFRKAFWASIGLYAFGGFAVVMLRILLSYSQYDERVLSLDATIVLVLGMGFYHASGLLASYLRSYLKEPMVKVSMISAFITAILAVIIAPRWGGYGVAWLVFFVNALLLFPATAYLYKKLRGEWQSK